MSQVVSEADGLRPEAGARAVGGPPVEGRTHDDGAGAAEAVRVLEVGRRYAGEGGVRAVHVAQPHAGEATVPTSRSPGVRRAGEGGRRRGKERPKRAKGRPKRAKEWSKRAQGVVKKGQEGGHSRSR